MDPKLARAIEHYRVAIDIALTAGAEEPEEIGAILHHYTTAQELVEEYEMERIHSN